MKSLEIPPDCEVYLFVNSRNIPATIFLGLTTALFIFGFISGLLFAEPWWFKIPFLFCLPLALIFILMIEETGCATGKTKCIISSDGFTYMDPQSRIGKWLDKKLQFRSTKEYQYFSWDDIASIRCNDKFFERRKKGSDLPRSLRIIFSSTNGETFELEAGAIGDRKDKKFRSVYNELKRQAMLRGIPFETELDNEEVWKQKLK